MRNRLAYGAGFTLLAAAIAAGLIEPLLTLRRFVPLDPNEGWNAFFAQIAMRGGDLYPAPGSLIVNNYPPLSFYVVGAAGRLLGDNIFAGRLVALLSMGVVAVNLRAWLRAGGCGVPAAWLGAAVFAAFAVTYARSYAGINDPQWLAHAIMTTGLVVAWRGNAGARSLALAALLMIAAGWTKHLLVPLPIATTWWLWRRSRPAFLTWIGCCGLLLAASAGLVYWAFGPSFFASLQSARQYSLQQAVKESRQALKCFAPIVALALLLVPRAAAAPRYEFALVYLAAAAAVAFAAAGGIGVDINAFFDVMIAASLCAALAVDEFGSRRAWRTVAWGPLLTLLLGAYLAAYAASWLPRTFAEVRNLDALERQTLADTRLVAALGRGRAACETPELCYWARGAFVLDFFNYGQRLEVGREPLSACARVFDGRRIPLLQLDPWKVAGSAQLPPDCNAVILRNYRPVSTSVLGRILAPVR
jgi:hypothetical protein